MTIFFVVFCLIVLLPNLMSKLIHSRCKLTCKLKLCNKIIRLQTNTELGPCFYALVTYSLLFSSEIILKQLFASGSVNIVNNPFHFVSGIIRQYSPRLWRIIVKYNLLTA